MTRKRPREMSVCWERSGLWFAWVFRRTNPSHYMSKVSVLYYSKLNLLEKCESIYLLKD